MDRGQREALRTVTRFTTLVDAMESIWRRILADDAIVRTGYAGWIGDDGDFHLCAAIETAERHWQLEAVMQQQDNAADYRAWCEHVSNEQWQYLDAPPSLMTRH